MTKNPLTLPIFYPEAQVRLDVCIELPVNYVPTPRTVKEIIEEFEREMEKRIWERMKASVLNGACSLSRPTWSTYGRSIFDDPRILEAHRLISRQQRLADRYQP